MKARQPALLASLAVAAALLASGGWVPAGSSVTIPSSVQAGEGNSDNQFPFNGDPIRYQQVVAASEFPAGQRWITGIALRPDGVSGGAFSETLGDVQINLSTTTKAPGTLSPTFANNIGGDETVVFRGALALTSNFTGPDGGPKNFDIVIPLSAPFLYNPAAGNLLLDVRNNTGGKTTQLDAHDAPDSTSRLWSNNLSSPTGIANDPFPSAGLVINFLSN